MTTNEEVLIISSYFPSFVNHQEKHSLIEEFSREEFLYVTHSCQKYKSLGPNGMPIEFFMTILNSLGEDLRGVTHESNSSGKVKLVSCSNYNPHTKDW